MDGVERSGNSTDRLEEQLTNLCFHFDLGGSPSMLDDETFRVFYALCCTDREDDSWKLILTSQEYPDPRILLHADSFATRITSGEPGEKIDYQKMRKDLYMAQDDLPGSEEARARMFQLCNEFVHAHIRYVRATTAVIGHDLYDKLTDRFYGRIQDQRFLQFWRSTITLPANRSWPSYAQVKQAHGAQLQKWQREHQEAYHTIERIKSSTAFKVFQAKLKSAVGRCEERQRQLTANRPIHSARHGGADRPARLSQLQREAAIKKRNWSAEYSRARRNLEHKHANLMNTHQLGNQSRVCLPDSVVHALTNIQTQYQETLFEEDHADDMGGYMEQPEKGKLSNNSIPIAVEQMHVDEDERGWQPCRGIIIPEGYVNLGPAEGAENSKEDA